MSLDNLTWGRELCDMTPAEANEINRRLDAYPDLLAACQRVLNDWCGHEQIDNPEWEGHATLQVIRAAIEKAAPTAHSPPGESR